MCTYRSAHSRYVYWATDTYIDLICVYLSIYDANDMAINPTPKMWQQVIIVSVRGCFNSNRCLFMQFHFSLSLRNAALILMQNWLFSLPAIMLIVSTEFLHASNNRKYDSMQMIILLMSFFLAKILRLNDST